MNEDDRRLMYEIGHWLMSDTDAAQKFRASTPADELASLLLTYNELKRNASASGEVVEAPMPTAAAVKEHYQNVRPGDGDPVQATGEHPLVTQNRQVPDDVFEAPMPKPKGSDS